MKTDGRRKSSNVEDRRGRGGGGGAIALGGGGLGIVGIILFLLLGGNPTDLLGNESSVGNEQPYVETEQDKELADFVSVVLADTEDIWSEQFRQEGLTYKNPTLVLYTGQVQTACGFGSAAAGPFYCPGDQKLYIDLEFYNELQNSFQAPGDFAMAYVVAHEVGHHVQTLLGISDQVMPLRQKLSEEEFNKYLVRFELQADYFAGVWAHHAQGRGYLEQGDLQEAITAAGAVGDDTIQKRARGYVVPESFTHGTAKQRIYWFERGFKLGTIEGGDTFNETEK
ncbi:MULTISPECIES: KPN_02809 family neutral zinc metallopeptidase [Sporosarcina]|uniref:KPN_02809 family neutral zinc metallopeptidase n=1 Tax=Sporosarcina TaxID=1569 RepID=UPI00129B3A4D|nr:MULTISPECIES: neutral zinc metallopeptidase [Sporosarcina]GKV65600.1 metalloprotease [Sporosarcina sp. NCCP-2331]GLB55820.1 metalloprotease [Sporosarcina sp. NCCP-2378]